MPSTSRASLGTIGEIAPLALRTYVRYAVPLTLLSVLALAPIAYTGLVATAPNDPDAARTFVRLAWMLGATAWVGQLLLVGGAAPAARAIATGEPLSQLGALWRGFVGMLRSLVPVAVAIAAIAVGSLALAIPGLVLFGLLALTAASPERAVVAKLADSVATVRAALVPVVVVLVALLVVDAGLVLVSRQLLLAPMSKKPTPDELAAYRALVRTVAAGLVIASPIAASALAAIRASRR